MTAPTCIDCRSTDRTVLVTQERRAPIGKGYRTCEWQICRECLQEYARVSEEIRSEQEAKALGRMQAQGKKGKPASVTDSKQGSLA